VVKNDRKIRIEVGYGLEGALTDAMTALILKNEVQPRFRNQDYYGGIKTAMEALMKSVNGAIARARSSGADATSGEADEAAGAETGGALGVARGASGEIRSRDDVRRALQRVCTYLEQHEPSNPASLFARRAERMLGMDFIGIVRELSPESMQQIQIVTGVKVIDE
ncbi:MAG: TPM domain-containing protein, partial [Ramlibacter sp.]